MTFLRHKIQISISYNNLNKNAYFFFKKNNTKECP